MQQEVANWNIKPLSLWPMSKYRVLLMKPINSLADLKGKKLTAMALWPKLMPALGITMVPLTAPEVYDGMQKGVIEWDWDLLRRVPTMKFYELAKYMYSLEPFGGDGTFLNAINVIPMNQISATDKL